MNKKLLIALLFSLSISNILIGSQKYTPKGLTDKKRLSPKVALQAIASDRLSRGLPYTPPNSHNPSPTVSFRSKSASPASNKSASHASNKSASPANNNTRRKSASPANNNTRRKSASPANNNTRSKSASPASNKSASHASNKSASPANNNTRRKSASPANNNTRSKSASPASNKSASHASNKSASPANNNTRRKSASHASNKTRRKSTSDSPFPFIKIAESNRHTPPISASSDLATQGEGLLPWLEETLEILETPSSPKQENTVTGPSPKQENTVTSPSQKQKRVFAPIAVTNSKSLEALLATESSPEPEKQAFTPRSRIRAFTKVLLERTVPFNKEEQFSSISTSPSAPPREDSMPPAKSMFDPLPRSSGFTAGRYTIVQDGSSDDREDTMTSPRSMFDPLPRSSGFTAGRYTTAEEGSSDDDDASFPHQMVTAEQKKRDLIDRLNEMLHSSPLIERTKPKLVSFGKRKTKYFSKREAGL